VPLANVRYRVKTTPKGEKIRLAFTRGTSTVVEAKNLRTGATHLMDRPGDRLKKALTRTRKRERHG
jgi:hypothetical protein